MNLARHQAIPGTPNSIWFSASVDQSELRRVGFRLLGGGPHQSKTMMLKELSIFLEAADVDGVDRARARVGEENLLGKRSASARKSTFRNLDQLYGLTRQPPLTRALRRMWAADPSARPMLGVLASLARDPLLRDTTTTILATPIGVHVEWPMLAAAIERAHPGRFSFAMTRSLSQNCTSTWTQSGHLAGRTHKKRIRAIPGAGAAAFAVLLARWAGFGGPTLLNSIWLDVLDVGTEERLSLLRQAQSRGYTKVRQAGSVLEITPHPSLMNDLGDRRGN